LENLTLKAKLCKDVIT